MRSRISSIVGTLIITCAAALASAHESWSDTIYVASNGDDAAAGSAQAPLRTVQAGLQKAGPGDTVFVKQGLYRERLNFPRDGAAGKPIVLTGEAGAILDGGTIVAGWERVAGAGNVHRVAYAGPNPYNLTWNNKYILRIRDEHMPPTKKSGNDEPEFLLRGRDESPAPDGMTILREGPAGRDTWGGPPYRSWDGVEAIWGVQNGHLYIGFGDASIDPAQQEITTAPNPNEGGATITLDGRKFITVRGFTVRNGFNAVLARNQSSDCIIENNTLIGGHEGVEIESGSSRIVVRKNEITLGYVHDLGPDNPRHSFLWWVFKGTDEGMFGEDRVCVELENVGSDIEVAENHLYGNFDGLTNQGTSLRLTVRNNLIEQICDDGIEPDGEETEARWHDNIVREAGQAYRHKSITGPGPMYVYRNVFCSKGARGLFLFSGGTTPAYIYHNTFATRLGFDEGSTRVAVGLPNLWMVNNIFSCAKIFEANSNRTWPISPHFEYNYCGGNLSAPLAWWGKTNKVVANGLFWKLGADSDFQLSATSPAREMGIDLSKPWTIDGIEHPALAGMEPGYFAGTRPDAGAKQYQQQR